MPVPGVDAVITRVVDRSGGTAVVSLPRPGGRGGSSRAGASAHTRYRLLRRAWRREIRWRFVIAAAALVVVVVPASVLLLGGGHRWLAGFFAGAAAGSLWALWQSPPGHVENWADGAVAERRTARVLRGLPASWQTVHDRSLGRGNLDHVVTGPGGVFPLDTKRWRGAAAVVDGQVQLRRPETPDRVEVYAGVPAAMRGTAAAVSDRLGLGGHRPWIQPVVVFWSDFPQEQVTTGGVAYVAGDHLAGWLLAQRERLDQGSGISHRRRDPRSAALGGNDRPAAPLRWTSFGPAEPVESRRRPSLARHTHKTETVAGETPRPPRLRR